MKTVQELYDEVMADKNLLNELIEAVKADKAEDFLKAHGCDATTKEVIAFVKKKLASGELTIPPEIMEKLLWS
jgi:hypothetical protein